MFTTQEEVKANLPYYLRQFVVDQNYRRYSPQDQAVWRYIMKRNLDFLTEHAHPAYLDGLAKTGISPEYIPDIDEMNERLSRIGWGAVVVDGFVPPAAFMEFQALKILVISAEMRNVNHILYTPAPDIVHEAAGHAPIIADPKYAAFLQRFGEVGSKAVSSKLDYEIYEAIRYLSIIKEYPDATEQQVKEAEEQLEAKMKANTKPSEAARLSRLHWWTVEYGLVGSPEKFKIYGAGLLSSVGESLACLGDKVKKIPLRVDAANYNYDITEMQPQLFVAHDFDHLMEVLEAFADTMCFKKGGAESVRTIIETEEVGTCVLSSGIEISGQFEKMITNEAGEVAFLKTKGPTQLAVDGCELDGHGTDYHADGYSSPVGRLFDFDKDLADFNKDDLLRAHITEGATCSLHFRSGISLNGHLVRILRSKGRIVMLTFEECKVISGDGSVLFQPEWGTFDMAVGARVVSVYAGSADKEKFNVYPDKSKVNAIHVEHSEQEKHLFALYERVRNIREAGNIQPDEIREVENRLDSAFPNDWLLRLELLELSGKVELKDKLIDLMAKADAEKNGLIKEGLRLFS